MAISVDGQADALAMRDRYSLEYPVLYDTDASVAQAWGVFNLLGDGVAAPATFVVGDQGELAWSHIGRDIADRPTGAETVAALADVQSS